MAETKTQTQNEPVQFEMPKPDRGQMVVFYPRAIFTPGNRLMAYVNAANRANCELLMNGRVFEGVRHRTDPVLKANKHAREMGAWEFSERDKQLDLLSARVAKLESLLK